MCEFISKIMVFTAAQIAYPIVILRAMITLEMCDLIDYVCIYNYDWGYFAGSVIDFERVKLILALIFSIYQLWITKHYTGSLG